MDEIYSTDVASPQSQSCPGFGRCRYLLSYCLLILAELYDISSTALRRLETNSFKPPRRDPRLQGTSHSIALLAGDGENSRCEVCRVQYRTCGQPRQHNTLPLLAQIRTIMDCMLPVPHQVYISVPYIQARIRQTEARERFKGAGARFFFSFFFSSLPPSLSIV